MESNAVKPPAIELSPEDIDAHYERFLGSLTATEPVDRAVAEAAVDAIYKLQNAEAPAIIWCESNIQILMLPSLLMGLLHSDMWELIAGDLTSQASKESWDDYWETVWPEIWSNIGAPLLEGMVRATPIRRQYPQLAPALIAQAKQQFGKALHSGRLSAMQQKLNREMYRRFWAPTTSYRRVARSNWVNLKFDIFSEAEFIRGQTEAPFWDQICEWDNRLDQVAGQISSMYDGLANRLGAEPRLQEEFIGHLPSEFQWFATAELMCRAWPERYQHQWDVLKLWLDVSQNVSACMLLDGVAFLCERPTTFKLDDFGRLHSPDGPALAYSDDSADYAWHGVIVDDWVIVNPQVIDVEMIESCVNIEQRRVLFDIYGIGRYMIDSGIEPIHQDDCGILYRRELPGDEPLVLLRVVNSTAEPDGTFREYFLRVPPDIETARQATAWTFGLDAETYNPSVQT